MKQKIKTSKRPTIFIYLNHSFHSSLFILFVLPYVILFYLTLFLFNGQPFWAHTSWCPWRQQLFKFSTWIQCHAFKLNSKEMSGMNRQYSFPALGHKQVEVVLSKYLFATNRIKKCLIIKILLSLVSDPTYQIRQSET